jgi:hypothetical protein
MNEFPILTDQKADGSEDHAASTLVLLTQLDVAKIFRCTTRTIRNWEGRGWLKPVRIGRRIFYRESDLINLTNSFDKLATSMI